MSNEMKKKEDAVFAQELNEDELNEVNGGKSLTNKNTICTEGTFRDIYDGKFPNCAATVESGSWCASNDACGSMEVDYYNMENCFLANCNKAWK